MGRGQDAHTTIILRFCLIQSSCASAYQHLCDQRGDGSIPRIKYRNEEVLLMSPLPVHGRDANLLADIVKALLDHDGREYDAFTPITMTLPEESGIEPDYCFYIDNWPDFSRHVEKVILAFSQTLILSLAILISLGLLTMTLWKK